MVGPDAEEAFMILWVGARCVHFPCRIPRVVQPDMRDPELRKNSSRIENIWDICKRCISFQPKSWETQDFPNP